MVMRCHGATFLCSSGMMGHSLSGVYMQSHERTSQAERKGHLRSNMSMATLHATLQIVFAWSDVHLHAFRLHGKEFGSTLETQSQFAARLLLEPPERMVPASSATATLSRLVMGEHT